jgi:hypothetical protein
LLAIATFDYNVPVVEKAQQEPHWPWFLIGVKTLVWVLQSISVGALSPLA